MGYAANIVLLRVPTFFRMVFRSANTFTTQRIVQRHHVTSRHVTSRHVVNVKEHRLKVSSIRGSIRPCGIDSPLRIRALRIRAWRTRVPRIRRATDVALHDALPSRYATRHDALPSRYAALPTRYDALRCATRRYDTLRRGTMKQIRFRFRSRDRIWICPRRRERRHLDRSLFD